MLPWGAFGDHLPSLPPFPPLLEEGFAVGGLESGDEDMIGLASQGCEEDGVRKTASDNPTFSGHYCPSFVYPASLSRPFMSSGTLPAQSPDLHFAWNTYCMPAAASCFPNNSLECSQTLQIALGSLCAFPLPEQPHLPPFRTGLCGHCAPTAVLLRSCHSLGLVAGTILLSLGTHARPTLRKKCTQRLAATWVFPSCS